MNPLFLQFAMSMLPSLVGGLGSDPAARTRRELQRLLSQDTLGAETTNFVRLLSQSPTYLAGRNMAVQSSNAAHNAVSSALAERGLGTSGIGAVASSLAGSSLGANLGRMDAGLYERAISSAQSLIGSRADALLNTQYGTSRGAKGAARGLEAFMPYLRDYMLKRMARPGIGGADVARAFMDWKWQ